MNVLSKLWELSNIPYAITQSKFRAREMLTSRNHGRYGDAVAVSAAPIGLHSIHGIYSLDTGLHSLTKTIGTITDFWHYIR